MITLQEPGASSCPCSRACGGAGACHAQEIHQGFSRYFHNRNVGPVAVRFKPTGRCPDWIHHATVGLTGMLAELGAYARYITRKLETIPEEDHARVAKYLPLAESGWLPYFPCR